MIEKVSQHTDKITVSKYVSETREYRSEEIAKVLAGIQTRSRFIQDGFQDRHPFREILAAIEEEKADLLVMGTKGRTDLVDVLFTSMSHKTADAPSVVKHLENQTIEVGVRMEI